MIRTLVFLALASSLSAAPVRSVEQVVRSTAEPRLEIRIDPTLGYLGHIHRQAMGGKAEFDQYIFSETHGNQLGRTFIVHFEHALPGVDFSFDYPRLEMVKLGRNEYLHQTWPLENWSLFESDDMQRLLGSRALTAPSRWLVSRYVRAVGRAKRAEIILFYLEPAGELPAPISDLGLEGTKRALWEPIARALALRARSVFTVKD
ncbi:MAG TPA: hypothetical protein VKB93_22465 [Thermoanaerobaculia bacterium]|nr:hypothetical protein [Thermoanaerobaculia bacterium]